MWIDTRGTTNFDLEIRSWTIDNGTTATTTVFVLPPPNDTTSWGGNQYDRWHVELAPEVFDPLITKRAASRTAHRAMVDQARAVRPTSISAKARHGYQQTARLPCYRGVRTR